MSAPTLKPLSMGKCLQDLKPLYDKTYKESIAKLSKSAPKLFERARSEYKEGNQEQSFIFFMRYLSLIDYIRKSEEYHRRKADFESNVSNSSIHFAMETAEKLSESLKERYQQQQHKIKESEDKIRSEAILSKKSVISELPEVKTAAHNDSPAPNIPDKSVMEFEGGISSIKLFKVLEKSDANVLVIDVRPRFDYNESHLKFDCCINVPAEILEPGISASKLAEKLPIESKLKWRKRLEVEFLVLMDWLSSTSNLQPDSSIERLQTIILKWDPSAKYRSKPQILNGGYEDWLSHYPMHCTNAKPQLPPHQEFDDLLHIDDVIYPELNDDTPKFSRENKPIPKVNSIGVSEQIRVSLVGSKDDVTTLNGEMPYIKNIQTLSIHEKDYPIVKTEQVKPQINSSIPSIDRSSKNAAMQKYKELEKRMSKGILSAQNLDHDREIAENELKELKMQQSRNKLTDKEKEAQYQHSVKLSLFIQDLQKSQREKEAENELLRKELEEYKRRDQELGDDLSKPPSISVSHSEDLPNSYENNIHTVSKPIENPGPPTGAQDADMTVLSSGSSLKRSRSSPNVAQLVQEPEQRPPLPHFDRNTKPIIQKPQTLDLINRTRNFHEVYGTGKPGLSGLKNLGNSCYMNSILQCISNISLLNNYFCSGKYKADLNRSLHNATRGEVAEEVAHVIRNLWIGQYRSIACRDLKAVVGKYKDQFRGCVQQDAHEFLTFMMDWLHNDLKTQKEEVSKEVLNSSTTKKSTEVDAITGAINAWNDFRSKHESFMLTAFFIQQVSTVQCSACSVKSMNFEEPTSNLTLLLPNASRCTLSECLRLYTSKERILGYKCDSCHGSHDAEKSVDLCRLPPILIIHLKRFYSDGFYQKRQTFVDFPLENLDMRSYTPNKHQSHTIYDLCAVSNHYGTLEGGHYTAYCKNGVRWYKFDDQDVHEIQRDDVKSVSAYILFYAAVK